MPSASFLSRKKNRLYKEFHALVDKLFDRLHLSATEKRLSSVRTNGNKEGNLYRDRERLVRTYEAEKRHPDLRKQPWLPEFFFQEGKYTGGRHHPQD